MWLLHGSSRSLLRLLCQRRHHLDQLVGFEWLDAVGISLSATNRVERFLLAAQQDDLNVLPSRIRLDLGAKLVAVHTRHFVVDQHHMRMNLPHAFESLLARRGEDQIKVLLGKRELDCRPNGLAVVDRQYRRSGHEFLRKRGLYCTNAF